MIHKLHGKKKGHYPHRLKSSECIQEALDLGCHDAKVVTTESIITGHWVRVKCQYGCKSFASVLTCPPYSPSVEDVWDLLGGYHQALLVRGKSGEFIRETVITLEKKLIHGGFHKAFGMGSGPCQLCVPCDLEQGCKYPDKARPSVTACGIDVYKTARNNGWNLSPLSVHDTRKDHIGMILID